MKNRLARRGILGAVRTDHIHSNRARKAQVEGARNVVLAPDNAAKYLDCFPQIKRISMNRNFKTADSLAAGQFTDSVACQKENGSSFASCLAQVAQGALLVGRQPVFQKIDVVGHSVSCFRHLSL